MYVHTSPGMLLSHLSLGNGWCGSLNGWLCVHARLPPASLAVVTVTLAWMQHPQWLGQVVQLWSAWVISMDGVDLGMVGCERMTASCDLLDIRQHQL